MTGDEIEGALAYCGSESKAREMAEDMIAEGADETTVWDAFYRLYPEDEKKVKYEYLGPASKPFAKKAFGD